MTIVDDEFWGDNKYYSRHSLEEIISLIPNHISVKIKPFAKEIHEKYSTPMLLLSDKLTIDTIRQMESLHDGYEISVFKNINIEDKWEYLMTIEPLRFYSNIIVTDIMHNYGQIHILDKSIESDPLVIIPYRFDETTPENKRLQSYEQADYISKLIVDGLNGISKE